MVRSADRRRVLDVELPLLSGRARGPALRTALAWGWQTFALGFASLQLLERRAEEQRSESANRS